MSYTGGAHLVKPSHTAGVDNDVAAGALLSLTSSLQRHTQETHAHEFIDFPNVFEKTALDKGSPTDRDRLTMFVNP